MQGLERTPLSKLTLLPYDQPEAALGMFERCVLCLVYRRCNGDDIPRTIPQSPQVPSTHQRRQLPTEPLPAPRQSSQHLQQGYGDGSGAGRGCEPLFGCALPL